MRSRRYVVTGQSFEEIKQKTNKDRTVKRRIATATIATTRTAELAGFVAACTPGLGDRLEPMLWNAYSRITLVSRAHAERLTIGLDLSFAHAGRRVSLPGVAVAEVKQDGVDRGSGFIQQMHAAAVQPTSFSKYYIGVALLYPHVKHNNFKTRLRQVQQLMAASCDACRSAHPARPRPARSVQRRRFIRAGWCDSRRSLPGRGRQPWRRRAPDRRGRGPPRRRRRHRRGR